MASRGSPAGQRPLTWRRVTICRSAGHTTLDFRRRPSRLASHHALRLPERRLIDPNERTTFILLHAFLDAFFSFAELPRVFAGPQARIERRCSDAGTGYQARTVGAPFVEPRRDACVSFSCQSCAQILFFENTRCERCRHALGFLARSARTCRRSSRRRDSTGDTWIALGLPDRSFRLCANAAYAVCNWLVDVAEGETFCVACRHNRVIPKLAVADNRLAWSQDRERPSTGSSIPCSALACAMPSTCAAGSEPLTFRFMADDPVATTEQEGHDRPQQGHDHDRAERGQRPPSARGAAS